MSAKLAIAQDIYQSALPRIDQFLKKVFSTTDRVILTLAMQSPSNHKQNKHFEALQQLRIEHHNAIALFNQHWLSQLQTQTLIDNSEAVQSLRKFLSHFRSANTITMAGDIPDLISASAIINSFLYSLTQTGLDIHSKILILRAFESHLQELLKQLNADTGLALQQQGIVFDSSAHASKTDTAAPVNNNALLASALVDLQANDYEKLDSYLNARSIAQWQTQPARDLLQELKDKGLLKGTISEQEARSFDDVKQLFSIILSDQHLPLPARALLACLQLPFTRIALQDRSFFSGEENNAKSLLNESIRLAAQWQANSEQLEHDDLYDKFKKIINQFWEAERIEAIPYQQILFDLLIYGENKRQKEQEQAQRIQDAEQNAAESHLIRQQVNEIIQEKLADINISPALQQLLDEGWQHVLYLINFRYGTQSADWQKASAVLEALAKTLKDPSAYASRTEFLVLLPSVLKALREGLNFIKLDPAVINQLFADLEKEHKQLALSIDDGELDDLRLKKARALAADYSLDLGQSEIIDRTIKATAPEQEPAPMIEAEPAQAAPELSPEEQERQQWLNCVSPGSSILWQNQRYRIAAFIKHTGKYIITDMRGKKAAEFDQETLLEQLKNHTIEAVQSDQIFGRALESVIGHIRRDSH